MKSVVAFCLFILVKSVTAQPMDWAGDLTIFGTVQEEHSPCLAATGTTALHAFCIVADDTLALKRSSNSGQSWSDASKLVSAVAAPAMTIANDHDYSYLFHFGSASPVKTLHRFAATADEWSEALVTELPPGSGSGVDALAAVTDVTAQPTDPYLNVCWIEGVQAGVIHVWFAQSRDRGATFLSPVLVQSQQIVDEITAGVATAVTWSGEEEVLHVASTLDRPGSVPEAILLYRSTDQGEHWSVGVAVDASAYAQREPALATFENSLFLVYARRLDAAAQRDIYFVYSPDGGTSFSEPLVLTDTGADDFCPRIVVDPATESFHIFYLSGTAADENSVMLISGDVNVPWEFSQAFPVNGTQTAVSDGGICVTVDNSGIAAAWTERFELGDRDVRFDASWRGTGVRPIPVPIPAQTELGACYPNPFNGAVIVPLFLRTGEDLTLELSDLLGRRIMAHSLGHLSAETHQAAVDLTGLPSGSYLLRLQNHSGPPQRLTLLR